MPRILDLEKDLPTATKKASFGMNCFWAPDSLFGVVPGVIRTRVGYTGGSVDNPTYRKLYDHTEAIDIDYDPSTISFPELLKLFWSKHDPTAAHKAQYMSAIFYHDDEQKQHAEQSLAAAQTELKRPVVTKILPHKTFYEAEDYHQKYLLRCQPQVFKQLGLDGPDLIRSHIAARLNGFCGGYGTEEQMQAELCALGVDEAIIDATRAVMAVTPEHSCGI